MDNNKRFPESWEDANNEFPHIIGVPYKYNKNHTTWMEEAARLMAESYESEISEKDKRIQELEAAIQEIDRTQFFSDGSHFEALKKAKELLK